MFEVFTSGDEPVIHNDGREAIDRWARATHTGEEPGLRPHPPGEQTRHNQSGTVFDELGEDSARTRSMLLSARQGPGDAIPRPSTTGVYRDEWRRTPRGLAHRPPQPAHRHTASPRRCCCLVALGPVALGPMARLPPAAPR